MTPASRSTLALTLLALLGLACDFDSLPGKPSEAERYRRPTEILDFETLYATNCAGCHGAEGRLGPARPFDDPLYLRLVGRTRVAAVIANGVADTAMPAFLDAKGGTLTQAQVGAISDGLFEKWSKPAPEGERLPGYEQPGEGQPARGAAAFATYCADCHGADGLGGSGDKRGKRAGSVLDPSLLALVSDQMLRTTVIAGRTDLGMPDSRTASASGPMNEREINDVVAWMSERRP